jgi:RND family efflux transporter MFP subunit
MAEHTPENTGEPKDQEPPGRRAHPGTLVAMILLLLLVCGIGVLLLRHRRFQREEHQRNVQVSRVEKGPKVFVAPVLPTPPIRDLTLPSEVRAYNQSTLYAKTAGFLNEIRVDKGSVVKAGQVLARVSSPETDRLVANARATYLNKARFYKRQQELVRKHYISDQDLENALYAMDEAKALLDQQLALQAYQIIRAPFDGTITGRYVDPGALIPTAADSTTGSQPVVDIADLGRLRIALFVSQDVAPFVDTNTEATIVQDERPELKIEAKVTLVSGALDPRSRTMLCEVWLDNKKYGLQPGTFVHVTLHVHVPPLPTIPSDGIFVRSGATMAAVVQDNKVSFRKVQTGIDDGTHVQVKTGLQPGQVVALSVPADLAEGGAIQPVPQPSPKGKASGSRPNPPR